MNDTRSAGASWRRSLRACAPFALAALLALASAPASAAIIRGYTDLYATQMDAGFQQSGGDTQYGFWSPCHTVASGPCAKTRFSFEYDTSKPPHAMKTSLELLNAYYAYDSSTNAWPGFPTKVIDGKEYLPLPYYSYSNIAQSYPQLGPSFAPDDWTAPPDDVPADQMASTYVLTRFAVGAPGNLFSLEFAANRETKFVRFECSPDADYYEDCRNLQDQHPSDEGAKGPFFGTGSNLQATQDLSISNAGGYFDSNNNDFDWNVRLEGISTLTYVRYAFDNNPENWVAGAPRARIWIVEAPEPASLSLLGVGLVALAWREGRRARRRER